MVAVHYYCYRGERGQQRVRLWWRKSEKAKTKRKRRKQKTQNRMGWESARGDRCCFGFFPTASEAAATAHYYRLVPLMLLLLLQMASHQRRHLPHPSSAFLLRLLLPNRSQGQQAPPPSVADVGRAAGGVFAVAVMGVVVAPHAVAAGAAF
jgi:hypothetical protein